MNTGSSDNRTCNVLVLGDSHVYWLEQFIAHDLLLLRYPQPAHGVNAIDIEYRGTRGGTVASMRRDAVFRSGGRDLPHAIILMVGGNDLDKWIPVHFGASFLTRACLTRSSWARPTSTRCQFGARQFAAFFQFGACQFDARPFEAFCNGNRQHAAHFMPHVTTSSTNSSSTV